MKVFKDRSGFPDRENTGDLTNYTKICFFTGNGPSIQGKFESEECIGVVVGFSCNLLAN